MSPDLNALLVKHCLGNSRDWRNEPDLETNPACILALMSNYQMEVQHLSVGVTAQAYLPPVDGKGAWRRAGFHWSLGRGALERAVVMAALQAEGFSEAFLNGWGEGVTA